MPKVLSKSSKQLEAMRNPNWETATGDSVKRWLLWNDSTIQLAPLLTTGFTGKYCKVGLTEMPLLLTAPADTVDGRIRYSHQEYLKYAAAYYLLMMRTDKQFTDMGEYFMAQFMKLIGVKNEAGED